MNKMATQRILAHPSVQASIDGLHQKKPGSIGDQMAFQVVSEDREAREYILTCHTFDWMCNALGTLHGGMGATIVDQAMGFVAYSYMPGPGTTPTIQMQLNYHRPMTPGADAVIKIRVISVSRTLISMTCEASEAQNPDRICITASATSFLHLDQK